MNARLVRVTALLMGLGCKRVTRLCQGAAQFEFWSIAFQAGDPYLAHRLSLWTLLVGLLGFICQLKY